MSRVRKVQPLQHEFVKELEILDASLKKQKAKGVAILTLSGILLIAYILGMFAVVSKIPEFSTEFAQVIQENFFKD